MTYRASIKYLQTSAQKTRLVVDQIRGKGVDEARAILLGSDKTVARDVMKVLNSAFANAESRNEGTEVRIEPESLVISRAVVDEGPTQKRWQARAMGRGNRILKRSAHITIELEEKGSKTES